MADAPYVLHYASQDVHPDVDGSWSVYREQYLSPEHDEPIDGSQEYVSTHPSEQEARREARRLQMEYVTGSPALESLLALPDEAVATTEPLRLRVEVVEFGNDRLDALDGWQGIAYAVTTPGGQVLSLHLTSAEAGAVVGAYAQEVAR